MSNIQAKKSDPKLAWILFNKIAVMYRSLKQQENPQASLGIKDLRSTKSISPPQPYQPSKPILPGKVQEVSPDLFDIQPHLSQIWNCDKIGFDPIGKFPQKYVMS